MAGERNEAACVAGERNEAACVAGERNEAACVAGERNEAACVAGERNEAACVAGERNEAACVAGERNEAACVAGERNEAACVAGERNEMIVDDALDGGRGEQAAVGLSTAVAILRTARPLQWTKNLLVFAAPGAAGVLDDWPELGATVLVFVAFCLASSGVYLWNDALDVDADRRHPTKRRRPIAAGQLGIGTAQLTGTLLLVAACAVAAGTGRWQTVAVVATYVATTMVYSAWLKHVAVIDLVLIASGFVLRAAGGAVAVDVPMSKWFVLCTVFGSLFIVAGKRFAELREIGDGAGEVRSTLETYTPTYLRGVLTMSCGAAIISYCLWALETKELADTDLPFYELSIVPMLTAMLRYLLLIEQGQGGAPEEVFAKDRVLQLLGLGWIVTFGLGVYLR